MSATSAGTINSRYNRFSAFRRMLDKDDDDMDEIISPSENMRKKEHVPPIKLLDKTSDHVHSLMKSLNISEYSIKKISIGIKILCETLVAYNCVVSHLKENKCQFFTHDMKSVKAFKVVLFGLDDLDVELLKSKFIELGLKCIDIRKITKIYEQYSETLYLISLENGSVKLNDLKKHYRSVLHTQVRWSFQRKLKGKPTQCHNCQMFGHGERNCHIKTYCGICAGSHKTADCNKKDAFKCVNCNGSHKASDASCSVRSKYLEFRSNLASRKNQSHQLTKKAFFSTKAPVTAPANNMPKQLNLSSMTDFPALSHQNKQQVDAVSCVQLPSTWQSATHQPRGSFSNNNNLFTMDELNVLVMEMISKLATCKSKADQFQVVAQLATKFLYSNDK